MTLKVGRVVSDVTEYAGVRPDYGMTTYQSYTEYRCCPQPQPHLLLPPEKQFTVRGVLYLCIKT